MNRKIVMEVIEKQYRPFSDPDLQAAFRESMRFLSDLQLISLAYSLKVDMDELTRKAVPS